MMCLLLFYFLSSIFVPAHQNNVSFHRDDVTLSGRKGNVGLAPGSARVQVQRGNRSYRSADVYSSICRKLKMLQWDGINYHTG